MKNSNYNGPKVIETILYKKHPSKLDFKERLFKFSLTDKTFSYRMRKEEKNKKTFTGKDIKSFQETIDEKQRNSIYYYGFQVQTTNKLYILFTANKEDFLNWIRIFKFYFCKVDILNQFSVLSIWTNNNLINDNQEINQPQKNIKVSKREERGSEYKYYVVEASNNSKIYHPNPQNQPIFLSDNQKVSNDNPFRDHGDILTNDDSPNPAKIVRVEKNNVVTNIITNVKVENSHTVLTQKMSKSIGKNLNILENESNCKSKINQNTNISKQKIVKSLDMDLEFENNNLIVKQSFLKDLKETQKTNKLIIKKGEENNNYSEEYEFGKRNEDKRIIDYKDHSQIKIVNKNSHTQNKETVDHNLYINQSNLAIKQETSKLNHSVFKASPEKNYEINNNNIGSKTNQQQNIISNQFTGSNIANIGINNNQQQNIISNNTINKNIMTRGTITNQPHKVTNDYNENLTIFKKEEQFVIENSNKEIINRNILENAYLKNTNKNFKESKIDVLQNKDAYAKYVGNRINEYAIPNIAFRPIVSKDNPNEHEKREAKDTKTINNNISVKNNLGDQKIFKISSDFEIEGKVKTELLVKVPPVKVTEQNQEQNVSKLNKSNSALNISCANEKEKTFEDLNKSVLVQSEISHVEKVVKHENIIKKDENILNKKNVKENLFVNTVSKESNLSNISSSLTPTSSNFFEKYCDVRSSVNEYQYLNYSKEVMSNNSNDYKNIKDLTDVYINNTKKTIGKNLQENNTTIKTNQPKQNFKKIGLEEGWNIEKQVNYINQPRSISTNINSNNLNSVNKNETKKIADKVTTSLNKNVTHYINHKKKSNINLLFNHENLHIYPNDFYEEEEVNTKEYIVKEENVKFQHNQQSNEKKKDISAQPVQTELKHKSNLKQEKKVTIIENDDKINNVKFSDSLSYTGYKGSHFLAQDDMHFHIEPIANKKENFKLKTNVKSKEIKKDETITIEPKTESLAVPEQETNKNQINVMKKVFGRSNPLWKEIITEGEIIVNKNDGNSLEINKTGNINKKERTSLKIRTTTSNNFSQKQESVLEIQKESENLKQPAEEHHLPIDKESQISKLKIEEKENTNQENKNIEKQERKEQKIEEITEKIETEQSKRIKVFSINVEEAWEESILNQETFK